MDIDMLVMVMYETLKLYDNIVKNYYKTIIYLKNKLDTEVLEYSKQQELFKILELLEKVSDDNG